MSSAAALLRLLRAGLGATRYLLAQQLTRRSRRETLGPARLRRLFERLGGTYLKLGQLLSLQADLLPRSYCLALYDLLDRVEPVALEHIEATLLEELGRQPQEVFERFDSVPLASASIAQVHRARLDGREVVVKVRRPEARTRFESDLRLLRMVGDAILALRWRALYWLTRIVDELARWTREELDFRYEARYQIALRHMTRERGSERVPAVVGELTGERVLVCEFLDGPTLLEYIRDREGVGPPIDAERLERFGFDPGAMARNLIDNFVGDALELGLFHADLHPANLLILEGNVVGYVDFGITGALSVYTRRHIVALLLSLLEADATGISDHFLAMSSRGAQADVEAFRRRIEDAVPEWFDLDGSRPRPRRPFTRLMLEMFRVARECDVLPSADGARYLRSVISIEGLIRQFAPRFAVADYLESVSRETLELDLLEERLQIDRIADFAVAAAGVLRRSPALFGSLAGRLRDERETSPPAPRPRSDRRALALASAALGLSLVLTALPAPAVGANAFTLCSVATIALWSGFLRC